MKLEKRRQSALWTASMGSSLAALDANSFASPFSESLIEKGLWAGLLTFITKVDFMLFSVISPY